MANGDKHEIERLERLNEELSRSLQRCRALLHDYGDRLAANANEPETDIPDQDSREA